MPASLSDIKTPVKEEMSRFEDYFQKNLKSPNKILTLVTNYLFRRQGKQMRPLLVFLSARAIAPTTEKTFVSAALIEMLHTATLVHDDVVDESDERRGQPSIKAYWNSKVAVLVGDFFLARGMTIAIENNCFGELKIISEAINEVCDGELVQMMHASKLDTTEEIYYGVIRKKTAALIAACTKVGAFTAGAEPEIVDALYNYGINLGIAFQIRDDIFDYQKTSLIGKPTGNDIKERKMTLPLIYALNNAPSGESKKMLKLVEKHNTETDTANYAREFVVKYGGMEYSEQKVVEFAQRAKDCLGVLPESEAKRSLIDLVDFNTLRKL